MIAKTASCLLAVLSVALVSSPARSAERVALVIGNAAYQHGNPLLNPAADATDVAAALRQCGFTLVGGAAQTDLSHEAMAARIGEFQRAAADAKVALFFFAGHGVEVGGANYLVPVDAKVEAEYQVKHRTLALDEVLGAMAGGDRVKIAILDCCRDNPLGRGWNRNGAAGLAAPKSTPGGTILLFSAAPGQVASDGRGRNSPFSTVLKQELTSPGLEIESVFKRVGAGVRQATGTQEPWMNSSFYGTFAFVPGSGAGSPGMPTPPGPSPVPASGAVTLRNATKDNPFVNSLGMKFVPAVKYQDGKLVHFCIWETRVQDYAAYAGKNTGVDGEWKDYEYEGHGQGPDHPVVNVSHDDAKAFAAWLTQTERAAGRIGPRDEYRLPTDVEWSYAVGIGDKEDAQATPEEKDSKIEGIYPWGTAWPPPAGAGNFPGMECEIGFGKIDGYRDQHAFTAPVGSYAANEKGIFDLGGNVWEWCEDWYNPTKKESRVVRGGSWYNHSKIFLRSSFRYYVHPTLRRGHYGFRLVVVVGGVGG